MQKLKYRSLVEVTSDWIWEVDQDCRYVYSSPKVKDILGFSPQEVIGKTPFDFMPAKEADRVNNLFMRFSKRGRPFTALENVNLHKNGHEVVLETNGVPIFSENGELIGYRGIDRDITERNEARLALQRDKKELKRKVDQRTAELVRINKQLTVEIRRGKLLAANFGRSEKKYRMLVDTMNEGLSLLDKNGAMTFVNPKASKILGYSKDELIGQKVAGFLDEANKKIYQQQIERRLQGVAEPYEIEWLQKNGQKIPILISPKPVYDENGNYSGALAVITDIRKIKDTENRLRQREKELETKTRSLEEVNTALKVLLDRLNDEKKEIEERVLLNIKQLITPQLERLKRCQSTPEQETFLGILEFNLKTITSNFTTRLGSDSFGLSPSEMNVANLIKQGKTSKEISKILTLSPKTIDRHRENIRKKLGLVNTRKNLRSFLNSIR